MLQPDYQVKKIYDNGDAYFKDVLREIATAKRSIYLESYIFELPSPGGELLKALEKKQHEGLDIKVLVDGVGSLRYIRSLQEWSEKSWVPVRVYNPIPWRRRWRLIFFPLFIGNLVWNRRLLNRRDHRKMILIDGTIAFLGSINISKVHFSKYNQNPWFDLAVQVEGDSVQVLERAFLGVFSSNRPPPSTFWHELKSVVHYQSFWFPMRQKLRLNNNLVLRQLYWRDLLRRIRLARSHVYIMNAYFVPHRTLLRSLAAASRHGVKVVVLLPSETDVPVVKWFAPVFYRNLLKNGVEIREMQNQIIHTKSVIIDDWALIGSNNLNYRSLIHDLEVEAVIDHPDDLLRLLDIWAKKVKTSRTIELSEVVHLSWWAWLRYRLVLLIRYFV